MTRARTLVLPLMLAACGPSKAHPLPRYPIDAAWARHSDGAVAAPAGPSITLSQAFDLAMRINESVELAQTSIETADIQRSNANTELTPYIRLMGTAAVQRQVTTVSTASSGTVILTPDHQFVAGAAISQPVFRRDFGASRDAAARGIEGADAAFKRARQQLERDVTGAYIGVLRARKLLKLANDAVDRAQVQEQLATARVKVGQSLRTAELLTEVELARSQGLAVTAEHALAEAEVEYQRLVGRAPPAELVPPALPDVPDPQKGLEIAMTRDDLVSLELIVQQDESLEEASSHRRWWPPLDVNAVAQVQDPKLLGHDYAYTVTGVLTVPLLQNGLELVDYATHKNATNIARLQAEQMRKVIVEQVQVAAQQIAATMREVEFAEKQRDAARENYKAVDKQARLGAITPLEVTNAQTVLTDAESAFEVAAMDRMLAVYDYQFTIGTLDLASLASTPPTTVDAPAPSR